MKRELKFRVYIPSLDSTIYDATVYTDGTIGLYESDFMLCINNLPEHIILFDDGVYHSDDEHFDLLLSVNLSDEWVELNGDDCIVQQYTGKKIDKELYEGDILKSNKDVLFKIVWNDKKNRWAIKHISSFKGISELYKSLNWGINNCERVQIIS